MDFLIEKTSEAEKAWDWLTRDPPADLPEVVAAFVQAVSSGKSFHVGPYDAEDARLWAMDTWGEAPAPFRIRAVGVR
jgi:hypothetical protein